MKLNKIKYLLIAIVLIFAACSDDDVTDSDITPPEVEQLDTLAQKEMRAAWIVTVWGNDWPNKLYTKEEQQKLYIEYLDQFVKLNMNAVFVQVRGYSDALYDSPYDQWSPFITGAAQGIGKDPGYDVLKFMIDEAHARNLEFHAWMNPYRVATRASASAAFPELSEKVNKNLIVDTETVRLYNPALPETQQYLVDVVKDIITKYDVDGIVFDDYFYPEAATTKGFPDTLQWEQYGKPNGESLADFRRSSVSAAIQKVKDAIVATKPGVLFTVSPAPDNSKNYNQLYADVVRWCQEGWLDIVMPQLYLSTGNKSNNFKEKVHWWPQFSFKAVPMIAHGLYQFDIENEDVLYRSHNELYLQFERIALEPKIKGSSMYSAISFKNNNLDILSALAEIYKDPAVIPFIGRKTEADPVPAKGISVDKSHWLSWDTESKQRSVVYAFLYSKDNNGNVILGQDGRPLREGTVARVRAITTANTFEISEPGDYFVTTLNGDNLESEPTEVVSVLF